MSKLKSVPTADLINFIETNVANYEKVNFCKLERIELEKFVECINTINAFGMFRTNPYFTSLLIR